MALRRGNAPQDEVAAIQDRIALLERKVTSIEQPGARGLQVMDYEQQFDPAIGEMNIHHPGTHVVATPDAGVVYWHDEDWRMLPAGGWPRASISNGEVFVVDHQDVNVFGVEPGSNGFFTVQSNGHVERPDDDDGLILHTGLWLLRLELEIDCILGPVGGWQRAWITTDPTGADKDPNMVMDWSAESHTSLVGSNLSFTALINVPLDQFDPFYLRLWGHQLANFNAPGDSFLRFETQMTVFRVSDHYPIGT